jgi:hypothetical protein
VVAANRPEHAGPATGPAHPSPQWIETRAELRDLVTNTPCSLPKNAPVASRAELRAFPAVAAVTCGWGRKIYPGEGEWNVTIKNASDDGIAALKEAFDQPDIPHPDRPVGCTLEMVFGPPVFFVAADGSYLVPNYPIDHTCERPLETTLAAVTEHVWTPVDTIRDEQVRTPDEVAYGCMDEMSNPFGAKYSFGNMPQSAGGPVFTRYPDAELTICVYHVEQDPIVGSFVRALRLDSPDSAELRDALAGPGVDNAVCAPQDTFARIYGEHTDNIFIELGGCWRLHRDDRPTTLGTADGDVVSRLLQRP